MFLNLSPNIEFNCHKFFTLQVEDDGMNDTRGRKYIATQGPLTGTMSDFYRMIWQEGARVIVNLARITERGKVHLNFVKSIDFKV